ncbi:MAG: homocysteine biosynthesis protein, partial [FCB group bacterium]|nr:homocysteine biosynthesis protein [FCB group bacterium]
MISKSYDYINSRIAKGKAVVVTAEEIIDIVKEKGIRGATEYVDVVTTGTFGPMCSSGAFLNFGHSRPPIRMGKTYLNDVESYSGVAAVDTYIGATQQAEGNAAYGGAHVIHDLICGKDIALRAYAKGSDCYPRKEIRATINKHTINEAYLFNPRNCYQNYNAATNASKETKYTYMGVLRPECGNINYSTTGELSPLLNDPYLRTIGIGTRILIGGTEGYVSWQGTQFNMLAPREKNGVPSAPAATLALIGDIKKMLPEYVKPAIFRGYGISLYLGVAIPIPILDEEILRCTAVGNDAIYTQIINYGAENAVREVVGRVNYEQLMSGQIMLNGKSVRTYPLSG